MFVLDYPASICPLTKRKRDDPSVAFMLSRLARGPYEPTPIGVFRDVVRPDYGEGVEHQVEMAQADRGTGDLATLLRSGATWEVG